MEKISKVGQISLGLIFIIHFWVGLFYWLWMAYDIGSWWMVIITLIPPFNIFAIVIAAWSLYFGVPDWIYATFGG